MAYWDRSANQIVVRCAKHTIIAVRHLKPEGKAAVAAKDWWNGVRGLQLVEDHRYQFV